MVKVILPRTVIQICNVKRHDLQASSMTNTVKATRAGSTDAPGVLPRIMQWTVHSFTKGIRVSRVLPQGEPFILFSGLVLQRSHVAPATGVQRCNQAGSLCVPQVTCLGGKVVTVPRQCFSHPQTPNPTSKRQVQEFQGQLDTADYEWRYCWDSQTPLFITRNVTQPLEWTET